jgi:predicted bacteriocin transport accessory protein
MSKKNIIIAIIITMCLILGICISETIKYNQNQTEEDKVKFSKEYKEVSKDNVFTYRNVDEIIKIMKKGTGVVYLGYPECPWCQEYVKYLNEVAKEVGIEKIYYCNTKKVKEENMEKYNELINILSGHLQFTDEGDEWIYVPNVSFHINGEIIGNDYETSKDTHNIKDPKEYWTEEEITELKNTLTKYMKEVYEKSNICTDCNK